MINNEYNDTDYLMFEIVSEELNFKNDIDYLSFEIDVV